MNKNKQLNQSEDSKVIIFAGELTNEHCILLDKNSNMLTLLFEALSELNIKPYQISVVSGKFGDREFFKLSIYIDFNKLLLLTNYINFNVLFYVT
jgi:hypothetical protein